MKTENGKLKKYKLGEIAANAITISEEEYSELLKSAKTQIDTSRSTLAFQVNSTANATYWNLGKLLHEQKIEGGYGSGVIKRLSVDLKKAYPEMGLSPRNLWYMKQFYERYCTSDIKVQRSVALLSWRKITLLITKKLSDQETLFYATESVQKNWNQDFLLNAVKMNMFASHKNELLDNNFSETLPVLQSEQANEIFKDSYNLGFLSVTEPIAVADYELIVPKKELQNLVLKEMEN